MKFTCEKSIVQDAVNSVSKAIVNIPVMPILTNIYIKAKDGQIIFRGYNLEIGIEHVITADVEQEGEALVNAKLFSDIIRSLGNTIVTIYIDGPSLVIKSGAAVFNIKWLETTSYPNLPQIDKENKIVVPADALKDMIKDTLFSVSTNEQRLILTGALFEYEESAFKIITLDSFRMSLRKENLLGNTEAFKFVIPGKTLSELVKLITNDTEEVNIYYEETQILFEMGDCILVSKLIQGDFFNYRAIITKEYVTKIQVNVKDFQEIIERNMLVSDDGRKYPLILDIKDGLMTASTQGDSGNVVETMQILKEGIDLRIGFNARYLVDAIRCIDDERIKISFMSDSSACTITPLKTDEFLYFILPVRIQSGE